MNSDTNIENEKKNTKSKKQREGRIEKEHKKGVTSTRQFYHCLHRQAAALPLAASGNLFCFSPLAK